MGIFNRSRFGTEIIQATAGYLADGRHLANRARSEASGFREFYHSPPQVKVGASMSSLRFEADTSLRRM